MTESNTALARTTGSEMAMPDMRMAMEPRNMAEGMRLAEVVAKSGLFGVRSVEDAFVRIATGMSLGITSMQALRCVHVVDGKPVLAADLIVALCQNDPQIEFFRLTECTEKRATWTAKRKGDPEPVAMSFTWEDATRAQLTGKQNWQRYPADMLKARAAARLGRVIAPGRLMGLYLADELEALPAAPAQPPRVTVAKHTPVTHDADGVIVEDEGASLLARIDTASDQRALDAVGREIAKQKAGLAPHEVDALKQAFARRKRDLADAERARQAEAAEATIDGPEPSGVEAIEP